MSNDVSPASGQFIDPLFAIVIGGALNETLIAWVKTNTVPNTLQLSIVSLGFVNLLLSWYGYHDSVIKKPIRGVLRFSTTIMLLPLYLLSIVLYNHSTFHIVSIYAVIFFMWAIWEWLRSLEYETNIKLWKVLTYKWNFIIAFVFLFQYVINSKFVTYIPDSLKENSDWLSIVLIVFAIIYLRIIKSMKHDDSTASRFVSVINEWLINSKEVQTEKVKKNAKKR